MIAFVLAITALYFGRKVFIPLALALVFSFLLTPLVSFLERLHFRRVPASITVLAVALALFGLLTWAVAGQVVDTMDHLSDYKDNLDAKIESLHESKAGGLTKATATIHELNKELESAQAREAVPGKPVRPVPVQVTPPASTLVQDLGNMLGPLTGPLETVLIAIIFTIFMLVKREDLRNRVIRLAGRGQLTLMTQALDDAERRLSRYLLLQFVVNAAYGLIFGATLSLIGVPHPFLWGLLSGLLRFVPYVGTFLGAAMPVALAIAVFPGWRQAAIAFAVFLALELTISNVVEPMLYGAHTGISSLAILVTTVFWATLWGPVGLILSTPLTVCLVVLGRHVPHLNFLVVVLGDEPGLPPEQRFYQRLLATDEEEATRIAEAYLKDHSVEHFYEAVLIPALKLAEQDYRTGTLEEHMRLFILRTCSELIEEMEERLGQAEGAEVNRKEAFPPGRGAASPTSIAVMPANSGPDQLVAIMLAQLLRHSGDFACRIQPGEPQQMMEEFSRQPANLVLVSCIVQFGLSATRSLCRNLKAANPETQIIAGLWNMEGGPDAARERLGATVPGFVTTSLSEALNAVRHQIESSETPLAQGQGAV
ncbi:MAG TPA: AI-2E family transporter [Candidatus Binatia bacterium]|nr:AI-2E family transporter [Candidatus Binatia bacterium]